MANITAAAAVRLSWDDDANEWTIPKFDTKGPLEWAISPKHAHLADDEPAYGPEFERALAHPITADDLAHMLGSALTQPESNVNVPAGQRPASGVLVHMVEAALTDVMGDSLGTETRGALVRQLVPIFTSVDANAHNRGVAEGRASA